MAEDFTTELLRIALDRWQVKSTGAFYAGARALSLGAGLFYKHVAHPHFDVGQGRFHIISSTVLVVTHECDVDQANDRQYNQSIAIIPLIPLESFADEAISNNCLDEARSFISAVASESVYRLCFIPPSHDLLPVPELKNGALIYFNLISSTHISQIPQDNMICCLSKYGLEIFDRMFERHFLRPKSESLPETR